MRRWLQQAFRLQPLAFLALAAAAGIVIADQCTFHPWLWFSLTAASVLLAWRRRRMPLILAAVALAYGFAQQGSLRYTREHPLRHTLAQGERVTAIVRGSFTRVPVMQDGDSLEERTLQAEFEFEELYLPTRGLWLRTPGRLRVWLRGHDFIPGPGQHVLEGNVSLLRRPWNPTLYDAEQSGLRQGIVAEFSLMTVLETRHTRSSRLLLQALAIAEHSRQWIAGVLGHGVEEDAAARTLITTMALGSSETQIAGIEDPFRDTGTLHIFAVSGLHVSLIAIIAWWFLRLLCVPRSRAVLVLVPLVFGYAFITGWVPSAVRSAMMTALILIAPLLNERTRLLNNLGLAALLLLAGEPQKLFQAGFQLSFGVVAAIALGSGVLAAPFRRFTELDPFLPPRLASWKQNLDARLRRFLVHSLAASLAAWAGSLPLMIWHFHNCTPVSVIANCVLVPLSSLSLFLVSASLLLAVLHLPWAVVLMNKLNAKIAWMMMLSAQLFAAIPGGHFAVSPPTLGAQPRVVLKVLSLPPGESANLLLADGQTWMIDCGSSKHFRSHLNGTLREECVSRLHGLILSHADADHVGGAPALLSQMPVDTLYTSIHEPWRYNARSTAMWQIESRASKPPVRLAAGDEVHAGSCTVTVLYPGPEDKARKGDDRCLVLRLEWGGRRVLWMGDAGYRAEHALLQRLPPEALRCDVLVRNQHVDDWSAMPEFLAAVSPGVIVSSNAPGIPEETIPAHLREWCAAHQVKLLDQMETGMVSIEFWPEELVLKSWLSGETVRLRAR